MTRTFRQGAIGALLDEYESAIASLKQVILSLPDEALTIITDPHTNDENCRSIQTILSHVVSSAFGYATSIYNLKKHPLARPAKTFHVTVAAYLEDLNQAFEFTEKVFNQFKDHELEEFDDDLKIKAGWGQVYDVEQMAEHAIVHVLRHRRQIERIKLQVLPGL
ncbi:DinB family protein [Chitinophaga arvensicola]|uniref:DinB family protein n=1 Tax=Chitinophaga arvensicola TaxID=29529 RepID=A0A1I0RG39_9BACT|nr:DinB family protein [Chitinophaga arvensicola]SEW39835.1 DinB family protein [Chitinophaga arvensicola]